jgi:hypothetical protein
VLLVLGEAGRGFPDGYITELDRALRGSRLGAVLVVLLLGIALARGKCTPRTRLGLRLGVAFGAVVLGDWLVFPAIFDGMPSPVERCRGSR